MFSAFIHTIKNILSDRKASVLILLMVVASRAIQLCYFYNIVVDASYQVIGTQSLLDGHGVSLPNVLAGNLSETIYTPLINWPPGYSFLLAPFYALFNNNYIAAGLTLDILSSVTLIIVCRGILKVLDVPLYLRNLFTLLTGFFIYYFYFNACSDAIAITFFLLALYFALLLIKSGKNYLRNTLALTFFLFAVGSFKYLFIPAVFVIPGFLFFKGHADRNKQLRQSGIISFLVVAVLLSMLLLYQKAVGGSATYISASGRGFFPENLLKGYPTIPASFIQPDTLTLQSIKSETSAALIFKIFQVVYVGGLVLLVIGFCRHFIKQGFKNLSLLQSHFYLSFLLSLSIILLLTALSLRVEKEQIFSWRLWTYVEDGRYYGLPNVLIHLSVFAFYKYYTATRKLHLRYIFFFLLLLMIPEMLRGVYFDINRIRNFNKEEYSWQYEQRFQQYADAVIQKEREKNPASKIVLTGTSYYYNHRVIINSHVPPLNEVTAINNFSSLNTKSPVVLLVIIQKDSLAAYHPFVTQKEVKAAGSFDNFNFYTIPVSPH